MTLKLHHRYYQTLPDPRAARKAMHRTWREQYDLDRLARFCQHAGAVAVLAVIFFVMAILFVGG